MKISPRFLLLFAIALLSTTDHTFAQYTKWNQCYGGTGYDGFQSVKPTTDGGFIAIGSTESNDSLIKPRHSLGEIYVVKTDSDGNQQWYNTYGGNSDDFGYDIVQTPDGGYLFVGGTYSNDGDFTGKNHGLEDMFAIKTDSAGNIQALNLYGGSNSDEAHAITASADGYYYVTGFTSSTDGDVTQSFGDNDFWLLKIDVGCNLIWEQSYGGSNDDIANAVAATSDSGCIIAGSTISNDGEVTGNHYSEDYWVVKVNSSGALQHEQCFGGYYTDFANGVAVTKGGDYMVCGAVSDSAISIPGPDTSGNITYSFGGQDFWVLKLNDTLGLVWQQSYGGDSNEVANNIISDTTDGSSYVIGYTNSISGEITFNAGKTDVWLTRIDSSGNLLWQTCIGDTGNDYGNSVNALSDGDIIAAGTSNSNANYFATNHGNEDGFITRLSSIPSGITTPSLHAEAVVYPNPTSNNLTVQLFNTTAIKSIQLQLIDVTGRTVLEGTGQSNSSYYYNQMNIALLPAGIYFLSMKVNNSELVVKKIVKD